MAAYYNEIDPGAAAWLRELIKSGQIAAGACRRGHARQLWRDAGGPLDAPERIPAGSHISGVCGPAARTVRREKAG